MTKPFFENYDQEFPSLNQVYCTTPYVTLQASDFNIESSKSNKQKTILLNTSPKIITFDNNQKITSLNTNQSKQNAPPINNIQFPFARAPQMLQTVKKTAQIPSEPKCKIDVGILTCYTCTLKQWLNAINVNNSEKIKLVENPSVFHSSTIPSISLLDYMVRICTYGDISLEVLIQAFIHLFKLKQNHPTFNIDDYSIHRLLLTSIMCSSKFHDDRYFNNRWFAEIGGLAVKELNKLEIKFLELVNFDFYLTFQEYEKFHYNLFDKRFHSTCTCLVNCIVPSLKNPQQFTPLSQGEPSWNIQQMYQDYYST